MVESSLTDSILQSTPDDFTLIDRAASNKEVDDENDSALALGDYLKKFMVVPQVYMANLFFSPRSFALTPLTRPGPTVSRGASAETATSMASTAGRSACKRKPSENPLVFDGSFV
jgi:hypothetical protein